MSRTNLLDELSTSLHRRLDTLRTMEERQSGMDRALSDSEARYRSLFKMVSDPVFMIDGGHFHDCNAAAAGLLDCKKSDIIGREPARFFHHSNPITEIPSTNSRFISKTPNPVHPNILPGDSYG